MKKAFLLTALAAVFALTACNKQEEGDGVDVSQLAGKWVTTTDIPHEVDSRTTFTFEADGNFNRETYDVLSGIEGDNDGTYEILSNEHISILTLTYADADLGTKQFTITKLNAGRMIWTKTVFGNPSGVGHTSGVIVSHFRRENN